MKKTLSLLFLACASLALAVSPTNVQKGGDYGTNNITGNLNIGSGMTLTIKAGATIVADGGSTVTGFGGGGLPSQGGHAGEFLTTDGTTASWGAIPGGGDMLLAGIQTVTGAKTFNDGKLILAGGTSGTTILKANATAGSGTVFLPLTGTLSTLAGSEAFTNKTYNGNTWTAGTGTLTLGASKVFTVSNTLTLTATDGSTLAIGTGGTLGSNAYTSTAYAPLASPTFTGTVTIPTPFTLGATSVTTTGAQLNFVAGVTSAIQTQLNAKQATITFGTGVQTALGVNIGSAGAPVLFNGDGGTPNAIVLTNATGYPTGSTTVFGVFKVDGSTITQSGGVLSAVTGGGGNVSNTGTPTAGQAAEWTNATTIQGVAVTGSGSYVKATSPTLVTPTLGAALATSINGNTFTAGTYTLTGTAGKTFTFTNSVTLAGTDGTTLTGPGASDTLAGLAAVNAFTGASTHAGIESWTAAIVRPASAMGALVVDVTKGTNTKTIAADQTLTFSGTPATAFTEFGLLLKNSDTSSHVVTIPSSYIVGPGTGTTFTIPASGTLLLKWLYDGTTYNLLGAPAPTSGTGTTFALTTSPAFVTPNLGVPSAVTLTNATGLVLTAGAGVTGILPVANGGTGLASGTSGGVLAYTASGTLASSGALAANAIVIGGGAGAAPSTTTTGSGVLTALGITVNTTSGGLTTIDGTATLSNKRTLARITTITSSSTPAVNTDATDCVTITALATAPNMSTSLTGTPVNFDQLEYRIKDDGTARAITWGSAFVTGTGTLPSTTTISKVLHVWFEYDSVQAKWVCASAGSEP